MEAEVKVARRAASSWLTVALVADPLAGEAQPAGKVSRFAALVVASPGFRRGSSPPGKSQYARRADLLPGVGRSFSRTTYRSSA